MARIAGVDLPRNKKMGTALTYIYGIGPVLAKELLEKSNGKLILPVDSKEANAFAGYDVVRDTEGEAVSEGFLGLDIGPKSIALFEEALEGAKTVVWNGPMGVFENPDFQAGTIGVMDAIVKQPGVK